MQDYWRSVERDEKGPERIFVCYIEVNYAKATRRKKEEKNNKTIILKMRESQLFWPLQISKITFSTPLVFYTFCEQAGRSGPLGVQAKLIHRHR